MPRHVSHRQHLVNGISDVHRVVHLDSFNLIELRQRSPLTFRRFACSPCELDAIEPENCFSPTSSLFGENVASDEFVDSIVIVPEFAEDVAVVFAFQRCSLR